MINIKVKKLITTILAFTIIFTNMIVVQANQEKATYIYLVRHGKTLLNTINYVQGWADSPLTEAGIKGAIDLALGLKDVSFDKVYSSDLERSVETAEIIMHYNEATKQKNITELKDLRETNFGSLEANKGNIVGDMIKDYVAKNGEHPSAQTDNVFTNAVNRNAVVDPTHKMETYAEFSSRVMRALKQISEQQNSGNVLVVAHGYLIKDILSEIGVDPSIDPINASVTILKYLDGKYTVEKINDLSYSKTGEGLREQYKTKLDAFNSRFKPKNITNLPKEKLIFYFVAQGANCFDLDNKTSGWADIAMPITEVQKVLGVASGLSDINFIKSYSSDMFTSTGSLNIILSQNKALDSNTIFTKLNTLRPRAYGTFEAQPKDELENNPNKTDSSGLFEDIETYNNRLDDALNFMIEDASKIGSGNVIVVTKNSVINSILTKIDTRFKNDISSNSVTKVLYDSGKLSVLDKNNITYGLNNSPVKFIDRNSVNTENGKTVDLNNKTKINDSKVINNSAYVALNDVAKDVNADIYWDVKTSTPVILYGGVKVSFELNSNIYYINDTLNLMEDGQYSVIINNRCYVPLEILAKLFVN